MAKNTYTAGIPGSNFKPTIKNPPAPTVADATPNHPVPSEKGNSTVVENSDR